MATAAATAAGESALRWFGGDLAIDSKDDGTPVTRADREAESVLRGIIRDEFPDHGILGEEHGESSGSAPYRWILDPIDGTKSFLHGVPLWGTLVGVEHRGVPVVGACRLPALGETIAAGRGLGCRWNGRPARVSRTSELSRATLVVTSPRGLRRDLATYSRLEESVGLVRGWSDCYAYCLVATGRADIALDSVMQPWDSAPFLPILEEAGGRFTDWAGVATIHGGNALATNGVLHAEALAFLRSREGS